MRGLAVVTLALAIATLLTVALRIDRDLDDARAA